jgi:hypothetical protein
MTSFNQSKQIKVKTMKKIYKDSYHKERRDFLKILASAGITKQLLRASPLLWGVMASRLAEAQTGPNKLMTVYVPNGCVPARWLPNSSLSNLTSLPMSSPYNNVRTQCNFLRGINHHGGGHGTMPMTINMDWGGPSFDVNVGIAKGGSLPFQYVNLGVMGAGSITRGQGSDMWNGPVVPPELSPYNAFRRLFSGSGSSTTTTSGAANPHQVIVDSHKEAITALRNKLGTYEKARLDSHLTAISAYESRFGGSSSSSSSSTTTGSCAPGTGPSQYALSRDTFEQQGRDMANIAALALQCNLTASVSLMLGSDDGLFSLATTIYGDVYHQSIHCCGGGVEFDRTRGHLSMLSANVIQELSNKGVINSTIFMEISDMGHGDQHSNSDIPVLLAGGGGRIQRGVSNAGSGQTTRNMMATAGAALGCTQGVGGYRFGDVPVISGVLV